MKALFSFFLLFFVLSQHVFSQGVGINSTGSDPDASAGLDVDFPNKGFLIPRLNSTQRDGISNPANGLQIYNIDSDCLEMFFNQGGWLKVRCGCQSYPDATFSISGNEVINNNVQFSANETNPTFTFSWTFESGVPSSSTALNATSQWTAPGSYNVSLVVTNEIGCSSTTTQNLNISDCTPVTYNFTNCGQTGRTGPSQGQCNTTYSTTSLDGAVSVTSGIQQWTVPFAGTYRITAVGAQGGNANNFTGGLGAQITGDFSLTAGQTLQVLVGQSGVLGLNSSAPSSAGGGGGGSFVVSNNNLLIAAAGGGGANQSARGNYNGGSGLISTTGGNSNVIGIYGDAAPGAGGGTRASGGNSGFGGGGGTGAGGGGYLGNGGLYDNINAVGIAFTNGGNGGVSSAYGSDGGFGGGGAALVATGSYGGGGGGYSGGGGSGWDGNTNLGSAGSSGGGGSFNSGTNQNNIAGTNSGQGYVTIEFICD